MISIGLGTGRCGTLSLAELLNAQVDADVTHESYWCPWKKDEISAKVTYLGLKNRNTSLVGDVACYLLPYVGDLLRLDPDIKFIVLKRDKDETVESWLRHSGEINHWTHKDSEFFEGTQNQLSMVFPKYDLPKKNALEKYWVDYYAIARVLEFMYPENVKIFPIEVLNTQDEIFDFIGIPVTKRIYRDFHLNKSGEETILYKKMPIKGEECSKCGKNESEFYEINMTLGETKYLCGDCHA